MKVAIIQEWLVTVGGSDKVVKAIADVFPNADIFTLVAKKEVCDELGIDWKRVHTSFIQKMPLIVHFSFQMNHIPYKAKQMRFGI